MKLYRIAMVVGAWTAAAAMAADPTPDPRAILQQASEAFRAVRSVRYMAGVEAEGVLAAQIPKLTGTVTLRAVEDSDRPQLRVEAEVPATPQAPASKLQLASDGKYAMVAHYGEKKYARRELPSGGYLLAGAGPLVIWELTATSPLQRELDGASLDYIGTEKAGDVECDVVHAKYKDGGGAIWCLAKSDHLPRRVQRFLPTPVGDSTMTTTLSKLEVRPELSDDVFRLDIPEGFTEVGEAPAPPARSEKALLPVGTEAPDWTLKTADGKEVSLKSLRGKIVYLDFWATWCGPCKMAMPGVQKLYEKYKNRPVAVFGVNCLERSPNAKPVEFMKEKGFSYPLLLDGTQVSSAYHVTGIPAFYLIGPDGKVLLTFAGFSAERERQVDELIEQTLKGMGGEGASATTSQPAPQISSQPAPKP